MGSERVGHNWATELNWTLPLDWFCIKQWKWVEVPYVLVFFSLQDMPDLCPMGTDLNVKPSASSCPLTLPLYLGLPTEQAEGKDILQEGLLNWERSSNNPSSNAALDYIGFNGNSDSQIREGSDNQN